jgi:putative addiction module component (TIGR02574 family)
MLLVAAWARLSVVFFRRLRYIGLMADTLDITKLTAKERLDLIGELWDSLAPEDVRLTPAQEVELGRRMATFDVDAKAAIPWEDIEAELDRRS